MVETEQQLIQPYDPYPSRNITYNVQMATQHSKSCKMELTELHLMIIYIQILINYLIQPFHYLHIYER